MATAYLKQLRLAMTTLFLLAVATAIVVFQRHSLRLQMTEIETLSVAKHLIDLPSDSLGFRGSTQLPDHQDDENELPDLFAQIASDYGRWSALEVVGQFMTIAGSGCTGACEFEVHMIGGGVLRFSVERKEPFLEMTQDVEKERQEWDSTQALEHRAARRPRLDRPLRSLFYVELNIDTMSNVVTRIPPLVFSNVHMLEDPVDFTVTHPVPSTTGTHYYGQKSDYPGDLRTKILAAVRKYGITTTDLTSAYLELRAMFARQQVDLPILAVAIGADSFVGAAFLLALALSAWASFLLRALTRFSTASADDDDEPWILLEPVQQFRLAHGPDRVVAAFELVLFALFHLTAIATSLVLAILLADADASRYHLVGFAAIAASVALVLSLGSKYLSFLRRAVRRHDHRQRASTSPSGSQQGEARP